MTGSRASRLIGVGLIAVALAPLGGCGEYLDRRETVLLGAGNAVQTNIVMQQIDPWPVRARSVRSSVDGERLQHAMERYRNPRAGANAAAPETRTTTGDAPMQARQ